MADSKRITEGVLTEILIRLPRCEDAIRCKLVCKTWFSLVSSHYFASAFIHHRKQHSFKDVDFSMVYQYLCRRYIQIRSDNCLLREGLAVGLSFLPRPMQKIKVVASFADLILCSYKKKFSSPTIYYICNPLTRQWVALPSTTTTGRSLSPRPADVGFLCDPLPCAACHEGIQGCSSSTVCSHNAHYKYVVVRILVGGARFYPTPQFRVELFSSGEGKWTELVVTSPRTFIYNSSLIAYERKLHVVDIEGRSIIVYDPFKDPARISRIIDMPSENGRVYDGPVLRVCRGRLRVVYLFKHSNPHRDSSICMWELQDYDMGTWCLLYKTTLKKLYSSCFGLRDEPSLHIRVLGLHPNDEDVVYFNFGSGVSRYNMRKEMLESAIRPPRHKDSGKPYSTRVKAFQLVHQWWPTPVPTIPLISELSIKE